MDDTDLAVWAVAVTLVGIAGYLVGMLVRSVLQQRRSNKIRRVAKNFALSISFAVLFFVSWIVQGLAEWNVYERQQQAHGEPAAVSDYIVHFGQSTLENWQSEFLQLFSFVVLSALFIHRGSAESKDGQDRIENTVNEIRQILTEQGTPAKAEP